MAERLEAPSVWTLDPTATVSETLPGQFEVGGPAPASAGPRVDRSQGGPPGVGGGRSTGVVRDNTAV
ncbi:MAG: hypothetical protein ACKOKG_01085, partial [Verrucomicrobiota bacterium]